MPAKHSLILALETATPVSSVALYDGPELLATKSFYGGMLHAKMITPMISDLLGDLEFELNDLAAVCVAKGPGSYTGLRVGVSTAKGLCMSLELPLLAVHSLEALAQQVGTQARSLDAWICPMIDARRMEVYCQVFDENLHAQNETEAKIIDENSFSELLLTRKLIFIGDGAKKCKDTFRSQKNALIWDNIISSAGAIGDLIWNKFKANSFEELASFEPFYLKDFVATHEKKKL